MKPSIRKKIFLAAAASSGLLGLVGYPSFKSIYSINKQTTVVDDYIDLPSATADLTKEIIVPEGIGTGTDIQVDISHWLLLSMLNSKNKTRCESALKELARQRKWSNAECREIAQALGKQDTIRLARTVDADIRLFLPLPSVEFIEKTLRSNKIEKLVKTILKDVSEQANACSSCTYFYTNLSIRVRPDLDNLAISDLNQIDKMMHLEMRKRKKNAYNEDIIKLKAILNNIICGDHQALSLAQAGILIALIYFRLKYKDDLQVNGLLSQILSNLSTNPSTREYIFTDGWIKTLVEYSRSEHLELSLPALKALANLDEEARKANGVYGNHIYLLAPLNREHKDLNFDVIFVHGLVGSVFKSWRQGSLSFDEIDNRAMAEESSQYSATRCWPKDWLPEDVPGLRILAVDYPTALSGWRTDCDLNKDTLKERAIHVMKQLEAAHVGDKPIIWVAHSMGGLLIKQMLVLGDEHLKKQLKASNKDSSSSFEENILEQTKGIVFYSVPHKGSNLDWIERKNLQKLLLLTTEVIELQKGSPVLVDLHDKFLNILNHENNHIKFLTYAEDSVSSFGVNKVVQWKGVLVHEDSLHFEIGPVYRLNIDHSHTCKPYTKDSITYAKTLEFIRSLVPGNEKRSDEELLPFISFIL